MKILSIKTRIALWFFLVTVILIASFSTTLYFRSQSVQLDSVDLLLKSKVITLTGVINNEDGKIVEIEIDKIPKSLAVRKPLIGYKIYSYPEKILLTQSHNVNYINLLVNDLEMSKYIQMKKIIDSPVNILSVFKTIYVSDTSNENNEYEHNEMEEIRLINSIVEIPCEYNTGSKNNNLRVLIVIAKSLEEVSEELENLQTTIILLAPIFLIITILLGIFLSKQILKPLFIITKTAEEIQSTNLEMVVPVSGSGDEIDKLAKTLNSTFSRLRETIIKQKRFTADASHELRTPLSIILTQAEVALLVNRQSCDYKDVLIEIINASKRMKEILEGLSLLARADAGMMEIKSELFVVQNAVEEICSLFNKEVNKKGIRFIKDIEVKTLNMDSRHFNIIIHNLLSNAIRFSDKPGNISIRIVQRNGIVYIEVEDEGIGIDPNKLPNIFDRFYRIDEARSRKEGGSGLGLSIVKMIVEHNNGEIEAISEPGKYTKIIINLPLS